MMAETLLFLDIETLGVTPGAAIWEVAAARFEDGRLVGSMSTFVQHDPDRMDPMLPPSFVDDYMSRFVPDDAVHPKKLLDTLSRYAEGRAIVCGSNPAFDMWKLELLSIDVGAAIPPWHYHPIDVPVMVHGYLLGCGIAPAPPWRSDFLSQCVGVDPTAYERHTAAGDVWWTRAMWDAITTGGR